MVNTSLVNVYPMTPFYPCADSKKKRVQWNDYEGNLTRGTVEEAKRHYRNVHPTRLLMFHWYPKK